MGNMIKEKFKLILDYFGDIVALAIVLLCVIMAGFMVIVSPELGMVAFGVSTISVSINRLMKRR